MEIIRSFKIPRLFYFELLNFADINFAVDTWRRGIAVITSAQLHSTKPKLRLCADSNPACGVSEIHHGEDL